MHADLQIEHFLAFLQEQGYAPVTLHGYRMDIEYFIRWLAEHHPEVRELAQLSADICDQYLKHLLDKAQLGRSTINRRYQALRRLDRWALGAGRCPASFCDRVLRPTVYRRKEPPSSLTSSQIQSLLRAAGQSRRDQASRNYALIQLMLQTGLTVGEVAALKRGDLLLSERTGYLQVRHGPKERKVMLPSRTRWAIERYFAERGERTKEEAVFLNQENQPLGIRGIQLTIAAVAERAKLQDEQINGLRLRYSFAAQFLKDHARDLRALATVLGLRTWTTARIYAGDSQDRRRVKQKQSGS
jgi:integrase/recombinase XerC